MPQISTQEFERLPLRVNAFLAGVPLWAVDLPRTRSCITLDEFLRTAARLFTLSPVVRALKKVRETALRKESSVGQQLPNDSRPSVDRARRTGCLVRLVVLVLVRDAQARSFRQPQVAEEMRFIRNGHSPRKRA